MEVVQGEDGQQHWLWKGSLHKAGYGTMSFQGKQRPAHYVSWSAFNERFPDATQTHMRHRCREKACVNPDHLEPGTAADNALDRRRDGTQRVGERHHRAKITEEVARKIKASKGNRTQTERAREFSTTIGTIKKIDQGLTWAHLDDGPAAAS